MISDGMADLLRTLRRGETGDPGRACARVLGAHGVALSLLLDGGRMTEPLWCHPELSARFEELQLTLGEGPGPDAVRTGTPVVEPDLDRVRSERWPALLPAARELGVHGVCCFPLGIGAIRVGVLTVLCDGDRRLSDQQYADATALTAALTGAFLNGAAPRGGRNGDMPGFGVFPEWPSGLHRAAVHQATGMVSVQLGVSMEVALLRLRAHAYASGRPLGEVAQDVVARRLRFDDDVSGPYSPDGGKG
ncbi:GAF and ANTAR domain-containing protein [Streptomyces sp. TLI_185]|uniref:ANTAR domain-containing protein n=1 Tax=Streptomyces sp. TLI_185 TaxID=2485151 RepID=UPI000F4D4630|nr:GAF and ANTAR domain-containing protein [Streptomyces sp. TLI_185]RPF34637.1 ANTAR domain-containing protein [Streptomyces sp. TLI_185]